MSARCSEIPSRSISDCGALVDPADGSVVYTSGTTYQSVATFSCVTGYTLIGDATRTCQADQLWGNSDPTCNINGIRHKIILIDYIEKNVVFDHF